DQNPAIVQRVIMIGNKAIQSNEGVLFSAVVGQKVVTTGNDWIVVRDCRLQGPFKSGGFSFLGDNANIKIEKNRFWNMTDGVFFGDARREAKANSCYSYRVKMENNTFHTMTSAAVRFKNGGFLAQQQNVGKQKIEIERNYFYKTALIVKSDDKSN